MVDRNEEEQLDLDQIQGDILVGLQKKAEMFVGFVIEDVPRFRHFLAGLHLTSMREALTAQARIDGCRANNSRPDLDIRGVNIAFTSAGLGKLVGNAIHEITDKAFMEGLASRSAQLNDPPKGNGAVANWRIGNGVGPLDGLLLVTGRGQSEINATMDDIDRASGGVATWITVFGETGRVRPYPYEGHEHFNYKDGVSQPSVRGRIDGGATVVRFLHPSLNPRNADQGLPGSDLHWPGEFVFGYAEQDPKDAEKFIRPKQGGLPWMRNGSYMVFRRLEQKVPEFHRATTEAAAAVGMSADLLEARLVGRFRSGAPISLVTGGVDDPKIGGDACRNNDFEFGDDDIDGVKCPYAAHIRKAYPRNDLTDAAGGATDADAHKRSEDDTQKHRILRRGIPFGPEVTDAEQSSGRTAFSRGLMFVCYQTSIVDQFEFVTRTWINRPSFALPGTGVDPLIGRDAGSEAARTTTVGPISPQDPPERITLLQDFVVPTGGGYFFMPSIDAVRGVLATGA